MSEVNMEKAVKTYNTLCEMLDDLDFKYERRDEKLSIVTGVQGDDFPIKLHVRVNPEKEIVSLFSFMPFTVEESKRVDLALAICAANYGLADGSFDFDLSDGTIMFRLTTSFLGSDLGKELFVYMVLVSTKTIDNYNDKFFMIAKGMLSVQDFIESER